MSCVLTARLTIGLLEHVRWIKDILMPAFVGIPPSIEVVVKIYITKSEKAENYESKTNESSVEELERIDGSHTQSVARAVDSQYVSFESGRPDLQVIIQQEIEKASGRMSINGKPKLNLSDEMFISSSFPQPAAPTD
jgi:hypothetical protein